MSYDTNFILPEGKQESLKMLNIALQYNRHTVGTPTLRHVYDSRRSDALSKAQKKFNNLWISSFSIFLLEMRILHIRNLNELSTLIIPFNINEEFQCVCIITAG